MASQRVQSQLAKQLDINAAGTAPSTSNPVPNILYSATTQPPFPTYSIGYNPFSDVDRITQPIPARPANGQGSAHPFEMLSEDNLHPILLRLEPSSSPLQGTPVPLLVDQATGLIEHGNGARPLRFFSHIPRWVAANVSGMLMELWIRLDPRVEMSDILDRVNGTQGKTPRPNTMNMRRIRFREIINVPASNPGRQMPTANEVMMIGNLTREQILLNTAMFVDLAGNRLLQPRIVSNKTILGYVDSGLAIDHYIADFSVPIPIPSSRTIVTLELRKRLQTLAQRRGLGNATTDYNKLSRDLLPSWWGKNGDAKPITDLDGKTHEEFVGDLLERHPPAASRARARRPAAAASAPSAAPPAAAPTAQLQPMRQSPGAAAQVTSLPAPAAHRNAAIFPRPGQANAGFGAADSVRAGATVNSGLIDPRLSGAAAVGSGAPGTGLQQFHVATPTGTSYYVEAHNAEAARQAARPLDLQTDADDGTRSGSGAGGFVWEEEEERAARYLMEFVAGGGYEEGAQGEVEEETAEEG